ncbi:chitin binding protein [Epinotia aporema granulovirus]|uniref:Chitin binding protein n=1 Tax=Epinotia aporema granulovirus TaxID=166056 RepID=K4ER56_9BBAC|nr:chitin binding protein [Epinotia aporema granulovirus]AER41459.1 chitin binding protein [Epinotia aporema granulovirus]
MNLLDFSTLIFVIFIIMKIVIYHGIKKLQKQTWFMERLCVNGYYGYVGDPFECDAYYKCPEGIKFFCDSDQQFDSQQGRCVSVDVDGCYQARRRLMLD